MLSDDNNSGLFTFLIGLIVLVMVGVGLSVLVDSRFSFSRSARDLEGAVATDKEEVKRLTALVDEYHFQLSNQQPKLSAANAELKELESSVADTQSKLKGLESRRDEIAASIPPLRSQFDDYRKKYRQQTWAAAVGESLGDLEIRGGRIYRKSIINKVSEVGLEIRHEDGIARIQGPDLSMEIQDRFQWDDAERMQRLQKEFADHNSIKDPDLAAKPPSKPAPVKRTSTRRAPASPEDQVKIDAARKKVIGWKSRVSQLSSERSTAQSNAYGAQTSVPGSLETWQARASRLTMELAKAKGELAAAKSDLEDLNPRDPLLRPEPEEVSEEGF